MEQQKFKARLGLLAVSAILLGCLGILILPAKAEPSNSQSETHQLQAQPSDNAAQAEPASHTAPKL